MADKPTTIEEYILFANPSAKKVLTELYECLRNAVPEAEQDLKWGSPAFIQKRILFTFAAYKDHINFYPTPAVIDYFKKELSDYKLTSGGISFDLDKDLPISLITKLAKYRLKEVLEKDAKWM